MRCPRCSNDNPPGQKFCGECGARLERVPPAPFAGAPSSAPVGAPPAPSAGAPPPTSPGDPGVAPAARQHGLAPAGGERKQVTVLRADLKGSLAMLADRDPEEARRLVEPVLDRMAEAVHRYEGTVSERLADGMIALFGAPRAHEDHAIRACYAALRMQASVRGLADTARRAGRSPVAVRVGINSGEAVVGAVGGDPATEYAALGDTAEVARRMEQAALPGGILIAADTLRLVEEYVETRPVGPVGVEGRDEPVEAHEVLGPGAARTRIQAAAARGLTRFVGRAAELERLEHAIERATGGHGQIVALIGEPGIGKSRLLYELVHAQAAQGFRLLETAGAAHQRGTPYRPIADLLRSYFDLGGHDDPRDVRERVAGRLAALDRTLEPAVPAILALLGAASPDPAWDGLDAASRRRRMQDAVRGLLLRESRARPVLLVVEDVQWIDPETQAWLDAMVESVPSAPLVLVVTYRPEYQHGWATRSGYHQIRLSPLPADSVAELLDGVLGRDPALEPVKRLLAEHTDGNPFFLEECARSLAETGVLEGARGAYRVTGPLTALQVPPTVQAVLAARIDRLPVEAKRVLETASVIGKDVPRPLLEAVTELPADAVRRALAHLQGAELLYERGLFPEPELTFTHMLTHDVAYAGLMPDQRRALHARIVTAMERLYAGRLGEHVERLAEHAVKGEAWDRALTYLMEAGARALLRSALREAVGLLTEALAVLERLPRDTAHTEHAADCYLMLRNGYYVMGQVPPALDAARRAEQLAARVGDRRRLAQAWAYLSQHHRHRGEHAEAIRTAQRALAAAQAPADDTIRVTAGLVLGQAYHSVGDFPRAIEAFVTTVPGSLEGSLRRIIWTDSRAFLAWSLAETGAFEDARSAADEAAHLAAELGNAYALAVAQLGSGSVDLLWGRSARAIETLERGIAIIRAGDVGQPLIWAATFLGAAYTLAGRAAEALPLLRESVELGERRGILAHQSWRLTHLAEARLHTGDRAGALETAEAALALAQRLRERAAEAWALRLLAQIAATRDAERDAAAAQYRHALALAEALGMRPLAALCHLGLGGLSARGDDAAERAAHLDTAVAMLRAMDMVHWLDAVAPEWSARAVPVTQ